MNCNVRYTRTRKSPPSPAAAAACPACRPPLPSLHAYNARGKHGSSQGDLAPAVCPIATHKSARPFVTGGRRRPIANGPLLPPAQRAGLPQHTKEKARIRLSVCVHRVTLHRKRNSLTRMHDATTHTHHPPAPVPRSPRTLRRTRIVESQVRH